MPSFEVVPATINAMVSNPTRPMSINRMIRIFPTVLSWAVAPMDRPTVAKAETTSNR